MEDSKNSKDTKSKVADNAADDIVTIDMRPLLAGFQIITPYVERAIAENAVGFQKAELNLSRPNVGAGIPAFECAVVCTTNNNLSALPTNLVYGESMTPRLSKGFMSVLDNVAKEADIILERIQQHKIKQPDTHTIANVIIQKPSITLSNVAALQPSQNANMAAVTFPTEAELVASNLEFERLCEEVKRCTSRSPTRQQRIMEHNVNPDTISNRFFGEAVTSSMNLIRKRNRTKLQREAKPIVDLDDFEEVTVKIPVKNDDEMFDLDAPASHSSLKPVRAPLNMVEFYESEYLGTAALDNCREKLKEVRIWLANVHGLVKNVITDIRKQPKFRHHNEEKKRFQPYCKELQTYVTEIKSIAAALSQGMIDMRAAIARRDDRIFSELLRSNMKIAPFMHFIEMCSKYHKILVRVSEVLESMEKLLFIKTSQKSENFNQLLQMLSELPDFKLNALNVGKHVQAE